jgi:hypothetical protein
MNFEMPQMTPHEERTNRRMHLWDLVRDAGLFVAGVVRWPPVKLQCCIRDIEDFSLLLR